MTTESQQRSKFVAGLRQIHRYYWPPKKQILIVSRYKKTGVRGYFWDCELCGKSCSSTEIKVDHIIPVGLQPDLIPGEIGKYADRLFVGIDEYQLICDECHKIKTKEDNAQLRKQRKELEFKFSEKEVKAVIKRIKEKNARPKSVRRYKKKPKRGAKTGT